jgi:hypothetical protein
MVGHDRRDHQPIRIFGEREIKNQEQRDDGHQHHDKYVVDRRVELGA